MHTTSLKGGWTVHHNGDYSGNLEFVPDAGDSITLPAHVVIEFVAEWLREKKLLEIENAKEREIFGIKEKS